MRLLRQGTPDARPDAELIAAFLNDHDERAFAEVVRRHGPVVWGACHRLLPDPADADDAFQATFLVLVRRGYRPPAPLGPWLYKVAVVTARKVRQRNSRRLAHTRPLTNEVPAPPDLPPYELDGLLLRMPDKYREAIVLCHLEGLTEREAADRLCCPVGTLSARVSRAMQWLRSRAGVEPRMLLGAAAAGAVAPITTAAAVRIASIVQASQMGGTVPAALSSLAAEVSRIMVFHKLRLTLVAIPILLLFSAAGVAAFTRANSPTVGPPAPVFPQQPAEVAIVPMRIAPMPRVASPKVEEDEWGTLGPSRPGEAAWKPRFRQTYQLSEGQSLKIVPFPFPEFRKEFYGPRLDDNTIAWFEWNGTRLKILTAMFGAYGMRKEQTRKGIEQRLHGMRMWETIERLFTIVPPLVEADDDWMEKTELDADFVVRAGATRDQFAKDFQTELREKAHIEVTITTREEEREVIVASGKYVHKPRPGQLNCMVDVSAKPILERDEEAEHDHSAMADMGGGIEVLFRRLGWHIGMPVVNEVDPKSWQYLMAEKPGNSTGYLGCRWQRRDWSDVRPMDASAEKDAVLKHVAVQTGLTFCTRKQKVWVLCIKPSEK